MSEDFRAAARQERLLHAWLVCDALDPLTRKVLGAQNPWDAYDAANECIEVIDYHRPFYAPLGEPIWTAWSWAVDLYELEHASPTAAHGVLRQMATQWLRRPAEPNVEFVKRWAADSKSAIVAVTRRS